jgi:ribonuclease BN (tRNA processing enzyme)
MNFNIVGHGDIISQSFFTSILLEHILIGVPPGTLKELKKYEIDTSEIRVIIITHLNGEGYFDLPIFLYHEYLNKRTEPLVIIGPRELKKKVQKLLKMAYNEKIFDDLKLTFVDALTVQNTNVTLDYRFQFIDLKHRDLKNCYGLIISNGKTTIGYVGETKACPGLSYLLKAVNHCIVQVGKESNKRITIEEFKDIANNFKINYIPIGYPDELEKEFTQIKNAKVVKSGEQFYI